MMDGRRRPGWFVAAYRSMAVFMTSTGCNLAKDAARGAQNAVRAVCRVVEAARLDWLEGVLSLVIADGKTISATLL